MLTFSEMSFRPEKLSSSARRNDGLPAEEMRCYLLITGPRSDPCPPECSHGGHFAGRERQGGGQKDDIVL